MAGWGRWVDQNVTVNAAADATTSPMRPTVPDTPAWNALVDHADALGSFDLRAAFAAEPGRAAAMTADGADLTLDYSKHLVTAETLVTCVAGE